MNEHKIVYHDEIIGMMENCAYKPENMGDWCETCEFCDVLLICRHAKKIWPIEKDVV